MIRRTRTFAERVTLEVLRDPLNLAFGLGFPLVLLFLLSAIQANVPVPLFEIGHLTPGIVVFGLSFMTLFSATLIARDRGSALLQRLYTTPMTAWNFILGYTLPILPLALGQSLICYLAAAALGLEWHTGQVLFALLCQVPAAFLYIGLGLLCGSIFTDKQVGGICGALLTNLSAWLSGTWFELELMGSTFRKLANVLPFVHAVEMGRMSLNGDFAGIWDHLPWVLGYAIVILIVAVALFLRQMKHQ